MSEDEPSRSTSVQRPVARVILVDRAHRVLLFRELVRRPDGSEQVIWVLSGGGVEAGESFAEAAARQLLEETALAVSADALGRPVARTRGSWSWHGVEYRSEEMFYFLRIDGLDLSAATLSPLEREQAINHRWWSIESVGSTDQTIYPRELGPLVTRLIASEFPGQPVELPW